MQVNLTDKEILQCLGFMMTYSEDIQGRWGQ